MEIKSKSEASRERILNAAGKSFRAQGFGGVGVDGLAKGAGLTSGAFYFHFRSKLQVFIAAMQHSLSDLIHAIEELQEQKGTKWFAGWVDYYLGFKRTCSMVDGCSFPTLTPEVERAGDEAKRFYEEDLNRLVAAVARGLPAGTARAKREASLAALALLSGGVNMARAVHDPDFSEEIATAVRRAAIKLVAS